VPDAASPDASPPPDALGVVRRRFRAPLIVGVVIVIAIAVAITVLVRMGTKSACPARGCAAGSSLPAAPTPTASARTTPSTPSQPSGTVAPVAVTAPLASVMPADVDLRSCKTTDEDPFLSDVSAYFACRQGATAQVPYLQVWGYQFAGDAAYRRGIDNFNAFVKFDPPSAEGVCPPAATYGLTPWHTVRAPNLAAGTLECYSDSAENHYYVWTDDGQRTIIVAESTPDQSFADLDAWWRQNNRNA
jgi:hypothetical protein